MTKARSPTGERAFVLPWAGRDRDRVGQCSAVRRVPL
ncbi:hypothetical protein SAMN04489832_3087 [Micromonospora cremea]|uniref:Uncharacterized protein n=1 Tax=Micromonospora cremea TaxID=709881 RepID=A0A1N5YN59_9ACTN|nr:hypothetical protein SAMN04489832_3087 [Micromonospora cremea]